MASRSEPSSFEGTNGLAGYELEARAGRGGMGVVWRARQRSLDRVVAVKLISADAAEDDSFRERFLREAKLAASIEHPNVLPVYEAGESDGRLFLAMRFVDGADLASIIRSEGPLDADRAIDLVTQISAALDVAHSNGLIHRDVKPANVLVEKTGANEHAYLTDFGIAKSSAGSRAMTQTGQLLGTVGYLAPELIQSGDAGPATDVYALACLLYELLTGAAPFERETDVATIWAHVQEEPRPLGNRFPAALDAVVRRGLAKRPSERFQSAGELAREASAAIADPGRWIAAPPPVESWPQGLPSPATRLVGRDRELAELAAALSNGSGGLLTITGPGGTGKTRLALELAARIAARFADGVHFVALAPVRDPSLVASTIAQAIGLRESGVLSLEELVEQRLREGELLLLLDNVEHLVPAASPLLSRLARAIHGSRLVLTSRAAVGVSGEQEYPLEPLSEPDAARLFEERARAVKPSLELDTEAATIVASICNKLDGLPLAIELAAARVRLMSPKAILARLDERLAILTGGPVDAPARQQTLRATIDWSYRLLEPEEQRLFAGLSAFPGGARLEAIEAVLDTDLDSLDALMRQSLLVARDDPDGEPRFAMLETIREYAAEQLEASGHDNELRHSQAAYVLKLAELADLYGAEELLWLDRLETEHDNIRAALTFALEHDAATALRIAAAVWYFWWTRGHLHEGRERLESALAATSEPALAHAIARFGNAILTRDLGEEEKSLQMSRENVSLFEALGNRWWLGEAFLALATLERMRGDRAAAEEYFDRAIAIAREDHEDFVLGEALSNLGTLEVDEGHFADAACHLEEAVAAWERLGSPSGLALAQSNLGCALVALGELERSEELMRQGLQAFAELRNPHMFCSVLDELGIGVALARGDEPRAARLLGGRDRLGRELALEREWHTKPETVQRVREELGPDTFEAAYAEGRAMSLDQLVACAIGHEAQAQQRTARPT